MQIVSNNACYYWALCKMLGVSFHPTEPLNSLQYSSVVLQMKNSRLVNAPIRLLYPCVVHALCIAELNVECTVIQGFKQSRLDLLVGRRSAGLGSRFNWSPLKEIIELMSCNNNRCVFVEFWILWILIHKTHSHSFPPLTHSLHPKWPWPLCFLSCHCKEKFTSPSKPSP